MTEAARKQAFLKMFSSAVINQALASVANLAVSLILIRYSNDEQYGYYVLATAAVLLATVVQSAFFTPPLANRLPTAQGHERGDLIGGLSRSQQQVSLVAAGLAALGAGLLWAAGLLSSTLVALVAITVVAAVLQLRRDFCRSVLLAYRRSPEMLVGDSVFALLLVGGALLAIWTPYPALSTVGALAVAALVGGRILAATLWRIEPFNREGSPGILSSVARVGLWSVSGAGTHWAFSQGYSYLVAATLDVSAVAAIAATRLLIVPVLLLSSGFASLMFPLAANWMHYHGARTLFRRLGGFALLLALAAVCYALLVWGLRDWIFDQVLSKRFEQSDRLLLLWLAILVVMVIRDQLIYLPAVRERFPAMSGLTLTCAGVSLTLGYFAMQRIGESGALVGLLVGELLSLMGILALCLIEVRRGASSRPAGS